MLAIDAFLADRLMLYFSRIGSVKEYVMQTSEILARTERNLIENHQTTIREASVVQLHDALSDALMAYIADDWYQSRHNHEKHRCA